jgi:hypothetical protein
MTKEDKEQLNIEISHIFESGANHLRIFEMVENFIDKRYKAINYTHSCESDSELLHKLLQYLSDEDELIGNRTHQQIIDNFKKLV